MDEEEGGDKMKVGVQGTSADIGDNNINTDCDDPMSTGDISVQMEHVETLNSKIDDNQQTDGSGVTKKTSAALPHSKDSKLCGWLHITTNKGPLKINRLRWFAYSDTNSRLYFYRNPHDFLPLGEIDISHATFYFDPSKTDKPGGFEIRSENKDYYLEAPDRAVMMFWLQELQKRRRSHATQRNSDFLPYKSQRPSSIGGLSQAKSRAGAPDQCEPKKDNSEIPDIPTSENMGVRRASLDEWRSSSGKPSLLTQSSLKSDIQDVMSNIKKQSNQGRRSVISSSPSPSAEDWTLLDQPSRQRSSGDLSPPIRSGKIVTAFNKLKVGVRRSKQIDEPVCQPGVCFKCKQLQNEVCVLQEEQSSTEDELLAHREIIRLHQKEVDYLRRELQTRFAETEQSEDGLHQMLKERDKHIVELEYCLTSANEEKAHAFQKQRMLEEEVKSLKDQVTMLQHMLQAKDEVIVKLTNDMYELEKNNNDPHSSPKPSSPTIRKSVVFDTDTRELEKLRDMCSAYELQHKFLTKEILELNELRQRDNEQHKHLSMENAKLEAKYLQTKSKYLYLLQEMKQPVRDGESSSQTIISQLLTDAIQSDDDLDEHEHFLTSSGQEYDIYGFVKKYDFESGEFDPVTLEAQKLERKSTEMSDKAKRQDEELSHQVKWENYMMAQAGKPLVRSQELKAMIRSGVPHEYKEVVWKECSNFHIGADRDKLGPHYYKQLVSKSNSSSHDPSSKQIELDLLRTLPNNRHYATVDSPGICKLRNVLLAYSWHNPSIGYCQGMNRIAAIILLFLSEEEAFWCLVAIIDYIMPADYYSKTMLAAQADQRVLKDLIQEKLPRVASHLEQYSVDLSLFTFNWFLTVFVDNIPIETFLRIWDAFLFEGSKVLFRFAVAFFKYVEEDIMRKKNTLELNHFMRIMGEKITDVQRVAQIAFHTVNPFPMRGIASKRQFYLLQVKGELAELDKIRKDLYSKHSLTKTHEDFSDDDLLD
ncbi:TBC1 domain family member 2B-like isoform X1 [Crassostrea angulata]|uniref:TBC1 domain family member 2B-like isoform X1 n=2 Tax=Magallana angulata TaxID=2784310 RepID=UPI0022B08953|nr:TBC1 domain family member 2B-like isoform X1 [Crassostrea angulata]